MPDAARPGAGRRIAAAAIGFGLVGLALISGFDGAAARRPDLAAMVPAAMRDESAIALARRYLERKDSAGALALARRKVAADPMNAAGLAVLAQAAALDGQGELTVSAIRAAAGRGWRDPLAQRVIIEQALALGAWDIAAQRIDATQRIDYPWELVGDPVARLVAEPAGRESLAARLAEDVRWNGRFLRNGAVELPVGDFVAVVGAAHARKAPFDCTALGNAAGILFDSGKPDAASEVWAGSCTRARSGPDTDVGFLAPASEAPGPFAWQYGASGAVARSFAKVDGHATISFSNEDSVGRPLAQRRLRLMPGSARLTLHQSGDGGPRDGAGDGILGDVQCLVPSERRAVPVPLTGRRRFPIDLDIPASGCDGQMLRIWLAPGAAARAVWLEMVRE